ncbi:protein-tyrosine-phosphatase [Malassezia nana]|uniref:Protein-tyrosine-phosphatase n=1 Tax=Malassezia nana TaxID=180528 RepID=A0AAF0J1G7_9BASI|nr:protein-tyrosine-phosphatase [Malassezia nana]
MSFQVPYKYIDADALASMLKQRTDLPRSVAVVDVRDDDYEGGHIVGAIHAPSSTFLDKVNDLLTQLHDCMGPKAARIYQEVRSATQPTNQHQQILVLRDGFGYFGPKFKQDAQLVEDWDEEAWKYR